MWKFPRGEAVCGDPFATNQTGFQPGDALYLWDVIGPNVTAWMQQHCDNVTWQMQELADVIFLVFWVTYAVIMLFPGRRQVLLLTSLAGVLGAAFLGAVSAIGYRMHSMLYSDLNTWPWALIPPAFLWVVPVMLYRNRRKAVARANLLIEDDLATYDCVWRECKQHPGSQESLDHFCTLWRNILPPNMQPLKQPVESISTLFAQADAVNEWFQDKVQCWHATLQEHRARHIREEANYAAGHVHTHAQGIHPTNPPGFHRASVKKPLRAIQKIRRSYAGRVDRVCDLVRGSVVCRTFGELECMADMVHNDPDVDIVRGKNRFDEKYAAASGSGGYRDAQLSLRLAGHPLELHRGHVAELQLHLEPIYKIKTGFEVQTDDTPLGAHVAGVGTLAPDRCDADATEVGQCAGGALGKLRHFLFLLGLAKQPLGKRDPEALATGHQRYVKWRTVMCKLGNSTIPHCLKTGINHGVIDCCVPGK